MNLDTGSPLKMTSLLLVPLVMMRTPVGLVGVSLITGVRALTLRLLLKSLFRQILAENQMIGSGLKSLSQGQWLLLHPIRLKCLHF